MRVAVTDIATSVEARLRVQLSGLERMQSSMAELLKIAQTRAEHRDTDLARALVLVAAACEQSAECIEADRLERRELVASLNQLVATLTDVVAPLAEGRTAAALSGAPRVLGGSVFPPAIDVDLVEAEAEVDDRGGADLSALRATDKG